jgi:hypothetical protein
MNQPAPASGSWILAGTIEQFNGLNRVNHEHKFERRRYKFQPDLTDR